MAATAHRAVIALNWPSSKPKAIAFVQRVVQMSTGNTWLTGATTQLAAVSAALALVIPAQVEAKLRTVGAVDARDALVLKLKGVVELFANAVQAVADANPTDSVAIIEGAGFDIKTVTLPKKQPTKATVGKAGGTAILDVLAVLGAITYYWQMSLDKTNWTDLLPTAGSKTTVDGLVSGTTYYFRFRVLLKTGYTNWSVPWPCHIP